MSQPTNNLKKATHLHTWILRTAVAYWRASRWHKLVVSFVVFATLVLSGMYGVALWYQHSQKGKPSSLGVTFIPDYASYLGLAPHQTYEGILNDLQVKHLRLVSYWSDIEPTPGNYNFTELDYEMSQAEAHGTKVSLSIGLRQPRWPECHAPSWVDTTRAESTWQPQLYTYMSAVVNRYKHSPVLQSYQLENEFFNTFGMCHNYDQSRLDSELALVHQLDAAHPVIISRSDNYAGFSLRKPLPDIIGISIYRRVWNHVYFTYPFPSWYYAFLAGTQQILTGKPSVVHELQAEPWPPHGQDILGTSLSEQNKTFDDVQLQAVNKFQQQTGIKQVDFWGAEYWYYRAQILHDPSVWNTAKTIFKP